jgi:rhodanese-related sulfurtransferase
VQWYDIDNLKSKAKFLDVRTTMERLAYGHFEDDIHIDLDELFDRAITLDKQQPYVVYCDTGSKAYLAERILKQLGYQVSQLDGGYNIYTKGKGK